VALQLENLKCTTKNMCVLPDGLTVDLLVVTSTGKLIGLELSEAFQYLDDKQTPKGHTRLQTALLKKSLAGTPLITLSSEEWTATMGDQAQSDLLSRLLTKTH